MNTNSLETVEASLSVADAEQAKRDARNARRRQLRAEKRAAAAAAAAKSAVNSSRADKKAAVLRVLDKLVVVEADQKAMVVALQRDMGLTYHNARYYVRIVYPAYRASKLA